MKQKGHIVYYNFLNTLKNKEDIFNIFIDKHVTFLNTYEHENGLEVVLNHYKQIYLMLHETFELEDILDEFQKLAEYKILNTIPYLIILNEIHGLENILITTIFNLDQNVHENDIKQLLLLFKEINERVAQVYLNEYIDNLISANYIRINSIHDILKTNVIHYYEAHLVWLNNLANHIRHQNKNDFVELDDKSCTFGKWLYGDAKSVILNNSKYKTILNLHKNLHLFANKIYNNLKQDEYHIFLSYLEKCEFISLSMSTELALIDNKQLNQRIKKDELTGALTRNSLKNVFQNQYELSLITSNSFILAICDLDFFKEVNDTYGHVAGDKMLTHFVNIVKKHIRDSDIIIRYGGEEFVLLLSTIKRQKGIEILETIRQSFQNSPLINEDQNISATVSIGMMEVNPQDSYKHTFVDRYINLVDQKLYIAKDNGRNRVEAY